MRMDVTFDLVPLTLGKWTQMVLEQRQMTLESLLADQIFCSDFCICE
jgi:hypothetical protein